MDLTTAYTTIGLWGPNARRIVQKLTRADMSQRGVQVRHLQDDRDRHPARARVADQLRRRPGLGALRADGAGPAPLGRAVGGRAGARPHGLRHRASTARPAGSRRATAPYGTELDNDYNPVEADMAHAAAQGARTSSAGRRSRRRMAEEPGGRLLHAHRGRPHRRAHRREALHARPPADRHRRTARRSPTPGAAGPTPTRPAWARPWASTSCSATCRPSTRSRAPGSCVQYFGELYPVTVARVGSKPLFDPENDAHPGLIG